MRPSSLIMSFLIALIAYRALGSVTEYTNMASWQNAVGNEYTILYFNDLPHGTLVTDQYASFGITFTDPGGNFIVQDPAFHDEWGLWGNHNDVIDMSFSEPMNWIGVVTGFVQFELYSQGTMFYTSSPFLQQSGSFAGLVSDQGFDSVRLFRPTSGSLYIDDLFFGPPIPAPSALGLLALAGAVPQRRRSA